MLMQLTKNTGKPHILKYVRDDGTETWMYSDDFFVQHDLSHYAIEKVMGYRTAFTGMLNNGMDIKDFEDREKRASLTVTDEAAYAENMANLFLAETMQGEFEDFNTVQQQSFRSTNPQRQPARLRDGQISAIRVYLRQLLQQCEELPVGETMQLIFSV